MNDSGIKFDPRNEAIVSNTHRNPNEPKRSGFSISLIDPVIDQSRQISVLDESDSQELLTITNQIQHFNSISWWDFTQNNKSKSQCEEPEFKPTQVKGRKDSLMIGSLSSTQIPAVQTPKFDLDPTNFKAFEPDTSSMKTISSEQSLNHINGLMGRGVSPKVLDFSQSDPKNEILYKGVNSQYRNPFRSQHQPEKKTQQQESVSKITESKNSSTVYISAKENAQKQIQDTNISNTNDSFKIILRPLEIIKEEKIDPRGRSISRNAQHKHQSDWSKSPHRECERFSKLKNWIRKMESSFTRETTPQESTQQKKKARNEVVPKGSRGQILDIQLIINNNSINDSRNGSDKVSVNSDLRPYSPLLSNTASPKHKGFEKTSPVKTLQRTEMDMRMYNIVKETPPRKTSLERSSLEKIQKEAMRNQSYLSLLAVNRVDQNVQEKRLNHKEKEAKPENKSNRRKRQARMATQEKNVKSMIESKNPSNSRQVYFNKSRQHSPIGLQSTQGHPQFPSQKLNFDYNNPFLTLYEQDKQSKINQRFYEILNQNK